MTDNSYKAPQGDDYRHPPEHSAREAEPFPYYIPITQFLLRIIGVYLLILGTSDLVADGIYLTLQWAKLGQYANDVGMSIFDSYSFGRLLGSLVLVVAGGYLAVSGRWVIEKVFLPASPKHKGQSQDNQATEDQKNQAPSNTT